jgi:hypothetical protein
VKAVAVGGEKGGTGKSTLSKAAAEAVPDAAVFELETTHRLLELGNRVTHFPALVEHNDVEESGGLAQREQFDALVNAIAVATVPVVLDIGANTATGAFRAISEVAPDLTALGVEIGIVIVSTADPAAISAAGLLMEIVRPWAAQRFFVENRLYGPIPVRLLHDIAAGATTTILTRHAMDPEAQSIVNAGGLSSIPLLDPTVLNARLGLMRGLRVMRDLQKFRLAAMRAVEPAAVWLVS